MEKADVIWAQNIVERWAIKKAVPVPRVTTISATKEKMLSGYQNNTIILYEKAWGKEDLLGKILMLANPFGYHIQCASGIGPDDEKAWELAHELVVTEVELLADARDVTTTRLMKTKRITDLDDSAGGTARKKGIKFPRFWRGF